jgi:ABC-2 type transport system permease protein
VLAAEWIKLRSVRSTYWALLVAVVTPIGISALVVLAWPAAALLAAAFVITRRDA